jgi:hypothetical protein
MADRLVMRNAQLENGLRERDEGDGAEGTERRGRSGGDGEEETKQGGGNGVHKRSNEANGDETKKMRTHRPTSVAEIAMFDPNGRSFLRHFHWGASLQASWNAGGRLLARRPEAGVGVR